MRKILYIHGFASSGASGTVAHLRRALPDLEILAPDLPVDPEAAMDLLNTNCREFVPDLIIGTSMGAMYAEMLYGYDRILVNPAFHLADTLLKNNGLGRQEFHASRQDGETSFMVTKGLLEAYRAVSSRCFSGDVEGDAGRVWGLFGTHDTLVDCFDEFAARYPQAIRFDGDHYLNDHTIRAAVLPVIGWVYDRRERRSKRTLIVSMEGVLRDPRNGLPVGECVRVFHRLSSLYDTYVLCGERHREPDRWGEDVRWADRHLGVPAWNRVLVGNHPELLLGDYLIASEEVPGFMGTVLHFGTEPFRTWSEVLTFFERLGGQ